MINALKKKDGLMDTSRMQPLIEASQIEKLKNTKIAIFGLGGVGGYALEALCRSGVGTFYLLDGDVIETSNLNRQLLALESTLGMRKVDVAKQRVQDINSSATVHTFFEMVAPDAISNRLHLDFLDDVDAIVDATDDVRLKASLALEAENRNVLIACSGGTGNRLSSSSFKMQDIYKTKNCPLARSLRCRLKKLGVKKLPILCAQDMATKNHSGKVASVSWVPSVAGLLIAEYIITKLISFEKR